MPGRCSDCSNQDWVVESARIVFYDVPQLIPLSQTVVDYACRACGKVERSLSDMEISRPGNSRLGEAGTAEVKYKWAFVNRMSASGSLLPTIQFPAVSRADDNVLMPTSEGNIQDGTVVDQYGNPDLMVDFAEEYLKQYRLVMPIGRLPNGLSEIMPALLLLVTAAELSVKAYWIRSGKRIRIHDLLELYGELDSEHRQGIEQCFANAEINLKLTTLGVDPPKVTEILGVYSRTYGEGSDVYTDSRYYAEPTEMFRSASGLRGASLVKSRTPYPIFLPDVVRALIDSYRFYSGPERLRRLGADLQSDFCDSGDGNHGEWGLIPSSLGLVVVIVSQQAGKDASHEDLKTFTDFKKSQPTGFSMNWMYGGNTLLFYRDAGQGIVDGKRVMVGLECRVWSNERRGMHSRDLYLLADALECESEGSFGQLPGLGEDCTNA